MSATDAPVKDENRQRTKITNAYKAPTGRIKEVLKEATKKDIIQIKNAWLPALNQLQKSQSALFAEAEPVAPSSSAFVIKFKYDIHCQMVAENKDLTSTFSQILFQQMGIMYEILCIPESQWTVLRENFIRENGLNLKKDQNAGKVQESAPEAPYIDDAKEIESEDPIVKEAEKMFGKDFIEVVED